MDQGLASTDLEDDGLFSYHESSQKQEFLAFLDARMAKLADALASGASGRKVVQVQVLFRAHS